MPKEDDKAKRSLLGEEKWLPHTALVIVGAIALAIVAVSRGWWGGLSSLLIPAMKPQLLLDTVGILLLVCLVLSFSLVRKIMASAAQSRERRARPIPAPTKPAAARLHELQEKLLILAANQSVFSTTLTETDGLHPEASKFHFDAIAKYMDYRYARQKLANEGRAYLLRHNLMPPISPKPKPKQRIPGSGNAPLGSSSTQK